MNKKFTLLKVMSLLVFGLLLSFSGLAQVTTSAISGVVKDDKGEGLPGATVVAVHTPTGTRYATTTDGVGRYYIGSVRVGGPYVVSVTYVGFKDLSKSEVYAALGSAAGVDFDLSENANLLDDVVVTATRSDIFNAQKTGAATNISREALTQLPTINRSITDFTRLTPQANGNSFGGRDGRYNNVQIDGANFNNGFGLNDDPLPGGGGLSLDAIDEIQVNIAPFDVRQAGFTGAGVNAITKSGTNKFVGSVYNFFRNENFIGEKVHGSRLEGLQDGSTNTFGLRVGGPIVKDKLFFFVNAEQIKEKGPNAGAVNLWRASEDGVADQANNITRVKRSDLEAVKSHLINQWGYDPGAYEGYANGESETKSFLARLDWNINNKHSLSARYNYTESLRPFLVNGSSGPRPRSTVNRVSQNSMAFESTMYSAANTVNSVAVELNSRFRSNLTNQFLATYSKINSVREANSPSEFPMIDIGDGAGTSSTYVNYISAGYELFSYNNGVKNDNINIFNNLSYTLGRHNLLFGASYEMQKFGNSYQRQGTSYYRYASVEDFLKTGTADEVAPIMYGLTYVYPGMNPYATAVYNLPSVYVQDNFNVNSKLEVTLGLRAEIPFFKENLTANPTVDALELLDTDGSVRTYKSDQWPKTRVLLSPRVGFRYKINDNNSFVIRGGAGIFTGRIPFVWLTNQPTNLGVIQNLIEPSSYSAVSGWIGNIRFNPDKYYWLNNVPAGAENVFIKSPSSGVPGTIALVHPDFKMPQVFRANIGFDKQIPNTPLTIIGDFLYTKDINGVYQYGANRKPSGQYMEDGREYYPNSASYTYNSAIGANNVSVLSNTDLGWGINATIGVEMAPIKGFSGSLHYSFTDTRSASDNSGSSANSAWGATPNKSNPNDLFLAPSAYSIPNRIVGRLSYKFTYAKHLATTISLFYNGANQGRYSFTYNGDVNGDGITADLMYIPNNANEINFVENGNFSVQDQVDAFNKLIESSDYLRENKGKIAQRNGAVMPFYHNFDLRLLQDIFTNIGKNKNSLQISADINNLGNLLNSHWGVSKTLTNLSNNPLRVVSRGENPTFAMSSSGDKLPTTMYQDTRSFGTTWTLQLGVRYNFN